MDTYNSVYNTICRICCQPSKHNMVPLLDSSANEGLSLYGKAVTTFANISLKTPIEIPSNMCQHCLYLLKNAITFKLKCEQNDKRLQKFIENRHKLYELNEDFKELFVKNIVFGCDILNVDNAPKDEEKFFFVPIKTENDDIELENENSSEVKNEDISSDLGDDDVINEENLVDKYLDIMDDMTVDASKYSRNPDDRLEERPIRQLYVKERSLKEKSKEEENIKIEWKCNICGKLLSNKNSLRDHRKRHYGSSYICELCGKGYATKAELQVHMGITHGIGERLSCPHCTFKTTRQIDLKEHIRLHTGERPFACEKCGLTFRRKYLYKKHILQHTEKNVQCPHCPKKFYHKDHLYSHIKTNHDKRRTLISCIRCGLKYVQKKSLYRHWNKNAECAQYAASHTEQPQQKSFEPYIE